MLIIAYPRDDEFFERAPFKYHLDAKMAKMDELLEDERLLLQVSLDLARSARMRWKPVVRRRRWR
jgi:hypothetical protein